MGDYDSPRMEPDSWQKGDSANGHNLRSIAISLKRIADSLDKWGGQTRLTCATTRLVLTRRIISARKTRHAALMTATTGSAQTFHFRSYDAHQPPRRL